MQFSDKWFSESHQLVFSPASVPDPGLLSRNLEPQGLIIDRTSRLGTAEVTRLGADEEMMAEIGKTLLAGWRGRANTGVCKGNSFSNEITLLFLMPKITSSFENLVYKRHYR